MAKTEILQPGKKIRDRKVTLTDGSQKKLSELSGKNGLVLYFYPKDNTSGCTKEAVEINEHLASFRKKGYSVVGVSPDSPASHRKFVEKYDLKFDLIADEAKALCEACGVWGEKSMYGKKYMGVFRSTFVVDPSLKVVAAYEKVKPTGHAEQLLADLRK